MFSIGRRYTLNCACAYKSLSRVKRNVYVSSICSEDIVMERQKHMGFSPSCWQSLLLILLYEVVLGPDGTDVDEVPVAYISKTHSMCLLR